MTKSSDNIAVIGGLGIAGVLAWMNKDKIITALHLAPPVPTTGPGSTAVTVQPQAPAPQPIILVSPPTPSLNASDIATAVANAIRTGTAIVTGGQPPPLPVQTPYGPVTPSNFNPPVQPIIVAPTPTPTPAPTPTPTPTPTPAGGQNINVDRNQFIAWLDQFAHNYYDMRNDPSNPAYKNNVDMLNANLAAMYNVYPPVADGLDLSPWR